MPPELILHAVGRGCFRAELDGAVLVERSETPVLDACSILASRGLTGKLLARHAGAGHVALVVKEIARAAKLCVSDGRFRTRASKIATDKSEPETITA